MMTMSGLDRRGILTAVCWAFRVGAVLALMFLCFQIIWAALQGEFATVTNEVSWLELGLAAIVYLLGHVLRIFRLGLLIGGWRTSFRQISSFHLMTAAVSLTAPLKIGEVYRIAELSSIVGGPVRAIVLVWWERAFDTSMILLILLTVWVLGAGQIPSQIEIIVGLSMAFLVLTGIVVFVVPENLRRLSVFIIRRYDSARTVTALKMIDGLRRAIEGAPQVLRWKVASIATLTAMIWLCEAICFVIVFPTLDHTLKVILDTMLTFLSSVALGDTLLREINQGADQVVIAPILTYLFATYASLAFIGLAASAYYLSHKLRWQIARRKAKTPKTYD